MKIEVGIKIERKATFSRLLNCLGEFNSSLSEIVVLSVRKLNRRTRIPEADPVVIPTFGASMGSNSPASMVKINVDLLTSTIQRQQLTVNKLNQF